MAVRAYRALVPKAVATAVILGCALYFIGVNAHFFRFTRADLGKYFDVRAALVLHIAGGAVALLTGPLQFWDELRDKRRVVHRRLGMAYVGAVGISAPCALYLASTTAAEVGWAYVFALQVWAIVWGTSTWLAYRYARRRRIKLHQEWMVRSYLVTIAFVVSALLLKLPFIARRGSFAEVSPSLFWAAWAVPFFAFDIWLSARRKQ